MEDAPLNLAHFHERRAEKHLKHHRYDEAIKCLEKSLEYIQDAHKTIQMPKAIDVVIVQEKEYKRQIRQIQFKKAYYESLKSTDEASNDSNQSGEELGEQCLRNSDQVLLAIDKTMKEFDARFNLQEGNNETLLPLNNDELLEMELKVKEIPNLAPLELPTFDYKVFQRVQYDHVDRKLDAGSAIDRSENN